MKRLSGKLFSSIDEPILGKITFKPVNLFTRKNYIFISNDGRTKFGYAANLVTTPSNSRPYLKSNSVLIDPEEIKYLNEGDIVSIEKNGVIKVLYEKDSIHNFLLLTERCNSSCIMCPNPVVTKEDDKIPMILKVISLINKDAQLLGITGGEPTLMGDKLVDLINACKVALPQTKLMLLTNGMKFEDFNYVKKIVSVKHPELTIDIPIYSDIDTIHNDIVGAKGFYKTIQGLYNLACFDQKIGLRVVIHRLNYRRLPQMAEFIYHNLPFVKHIAFMQMEPSGVAKVNIDELWVDPYDYINELERTILYLHRREMRVSIYNAQLCVLSPILWEYTKRSISTWKNIYIDTCKDCDYKENCGGFFASSLEIYSKHIKAFKLS
ncbi:MAG TPA: His-Xaa-Ser system radical SAM maturase HxsC [Coxiellaceae bacterium]|nr:MAG: His-Xaa-Ser system radical SAM maturase HxsC [Gammaproteobacteria bacterium RBG_16_37_9]HBS52093.1 His-Xaa-Ser system radical SAM maturase HxsC [Coxiellaceae bacterium]